MKCACENQLPPGAVASPKCVRDIWLFSEFDPEALAAMASVGQRRVFRQGEAVFHQGDAADAMFLIKSGRIRLSKLFADGREVTLDYRKAGDTFGENMFGEAIHYPVSAWCLEETFTCGFSKGDFERMILDHPAIGLRIIRKQSEQIASLTTRLGDMALPSLEARLHRVLLNVAREHGVAGDQGLRIQFPLTHEELSFLTGSHRVTITKALKKLEAAGKILKEGRSYIVAETVD